MGGTQNQLATIILTHAWCFSRHSVLLRLFGLCTHLSLVVWPDGAISISQRGSGDRTAEWLYDYPATHPRSQLLLARLTTISLVTPLELSFNT